MILGNDTGVAMAPLDLIVSAIAVAFLQLTDDLGNDFERLGADIDCDRAFIRCWRLQGRKLAIEQPHGHEVLLPRGQSPVDEIVRSLEVY